MGYKAIALSQVEGTEGNTIALDLAEKLGFGYLNEEIVGQVAADQGLDTAVVVDAERRRSFLDRVASVAARGGVEGVAAGHTNLTSDPDKLLPLIRDAVQDAANRGNVVLVAHAACYACADRPDVLRISLTAPMETRVARVAAAKDISDKDAAKALKQSDTARASYLKKAHGVSNESPSDYDLVINTERVTPAAAVDLILGLVQAP
jgi:cytidylate kinase